MAGRLSEAIEAGETCVTIVAEFRLITSSSKDGDRFVAKLEMCQVPNAGECININGHPYIVHERGWAIGADDPTQYAYLRIVSHHGDVLSLTGGGLKM